MRRCLAALAAPWLLSVAFSCFPILAWSQAAFAEKRSVPLFLSASNAQQQGFVRIINRSDQSGEATIHAIDDSGRRFGPVRFALEAKATGHFNSQDLERGNADKGLAPGIGGGQGDWRLEVESDLDIEVLAYMRTADGFLTSLHDLVPEADGHLRAAIFNPGSNRAQESRLRLINPGAEDAEVAITGQDDAGNRGEDAVNIRVPAGEAYTVTASQLEAGHQSFTGRLGDGAGKWQLSISASAPIQAMSLLGSPTGHLTNLSTAADARLARRSEDAATTTHAVPLFMPASNARQQGFVRVINRSGESGEVAIHAIDDAGRRFGPVSLELDWWEGPAMHFNSDDLETGNPDKGLARGVGRGQGDWRLEIESGLDIEVLAYMRTVDGFLTSLHDLVPEADGHHRAAIFNPGSNRSQESRLRLINPGAEDAKVAIRGLDDRGAPAPAGEACIRVPAGQARTITASQLESGHPSFAGRLGDGAGKWQLLISASAPIQAMSLLESPTGHLTNLSTGAAGGLGAFSEAGLEGLDCEAGAIDAGAGAPVEIPDANLRAAIEAALGKAPGEAIGMAEMKRLVELEAFGTSIADLTGLEYATRLEHLELRGSANSISDLSPLSGLTGLKYLDLSGSSISDLSPLSGLTGLKYLNLSGSSISDLSPLSGLTNLKRLTLSRNAISDLSPLSGLANLGSVGLSGNEIVDVSPLVTLADLKVRGVGAGVLLSISLESNPLSEASVDKLLDMLGDGVDVDGRVFEVLGTDDQTPVSIPDVKLRKAILRAIHGYYDEGSEPPLTKGGIAKLVRLGIPSTVVDLTGLEQASNLVSLYIGGGEIEDLSVLSDLPSLRRLTLWRSPATDLSPLSSLTGLRSLELDNYDWYGLDYDFSPLSSLTSLRHLKLLNVRFSDLSPLSGLANLRWLKLDNNRTISDLSPLSGLVGLKQLDLDGNDISDLSPLSGMVGLTRLSLWSNEIADLSPLSSLTGLTTLELQNNDISDLSPLSSLTGLTTLNLKDNDDISDVSPLSSLTSLRSLELSQNRSISDLSPLSGLAGLEVLHCNRCSISDLSQLSGLTSLTHLQLDWLSRDAHNKPIKLDLAGLQGLTALEELSLGGAHVFNSNLTSLYGLTELAVISLSHGTLEGGLSALSGLTGLRVLNCGYCDIRYPAPPSGLTSLQDINCRECKTASLSFLSGLTSLRNFNCEGCGISDLTPLSGLTLLESFSCSNCRISDLTPLSGLTNLKFLGLAYNSIFDVSPLLANAGLGPGDRIDLRGNDLLSANDNRIAGEIGAEVELPSVDRLVELHGRFRTVVEKALGKAPGDEISVKDMGPLVRLEVPRPKFSDHSVLDLSGIEFADGLTHFSARWQRLSTSIHLTPDSDSGKPWRLGYLQHLTHLDLQGNHITDISWLSDLTNLTYLDLRWSHGFPRINSEDVLDLSPLSGLRDLTYLDLDQQLFADISALSSLTSLTYLKLAPPSYIGASITIDGCGWVTRSDANNLVLSALLSPLDLSPLSSLDGLKTLIILDNKYGKITNLSGLAGLAGLHTLQLSGKLIADLSDLAGLVGLHTLRLSGRFITDLSPLSGMTGLTSLSLDGGGIADLSPLSGMAGLTSLALQGGGAIADLSPLSGMAGLTYLDLDGNAIADLSPLSGMAGLTYLDLDGNAIADLSPLSGLASLDTLRLSRNPIADLSPLSGLDGLRILTLQGGGAIADLSPLSGMAGLTYLDLDGNAIADLSPLSGLASLDTLRLSRNPIADLSPLSGLDGLRILTLQGGGAIADLSPLSGMAGLTYLDLDGNAVSDLSPLSGMASLNHLRLCDNDISELSDLATLDLSISTLALCGNSISDVSPLLAENFIVRDGGHIDLRFNPLTGMSRNTAIPALRDRGFDVDVSAVASGANGEFPHSLLTQIYNEKLLVMGTGDASRYFIAQEDLPYYTTEFYRWFEDVFDYLFILTPELDVDINVDRQGTLGFYRPVSNTVRGIGRSIFYDRSHGSRGKLKGLIWMQGTGFGPTALHELMHTWANFAITEHVRTAHWGTSSANGLLGGFDLATLQNLGGGRYSAASFATQSSTPGLPYSPIELYFSGYIPPDEVSDLWVGYPSLGVRLLPSYLTEFNVEKVIELSIDDIIAKVGVRSPDSATAQRHHRAAVIVLSKNPHDIPSWILQDASEAISTFSHKGADDNPDYYNFFEATGGRGSITMDGLSQYRKPKPALSALPASYGEPPPSPSFSCYCPPDWNGTVGFTHRHSIEHDIRFQERLPRTGAPPQHGSAGPEAKGGDGWLGELQSRIEAHAASDIPEPEPSRRP